MGLDWIVITADRLVRQQSKRSAYFGVLQDHLRFVGPVGRAQRCSPRGILPARVAFVELTAEPGIPGQDVWQVVPNNMRQPAQAAIMCAALRGHAAALPRAPAGQSSTNRPAASQAMLPCGSRAWCWVIVALGSHSCMLRMYDHGGVPGLAIRPADLDALHLGTLSDGGGTALFLQWTLAAAAALRCCRNYGGNAFRLVMAETMEPWLCAFVAPGGPWRATGRSSPMRGAARWRGSFPWRG